MITETSGYRCGCGGYNRQADLESYYDPMSQQRHTQEMVELTGSGSQDANLKKEVSK